MAPTITLEEAEEQLAVELVEAYADIASGDDFGRAGSIRALETIWSVLRDRGFPGQLISPLANLVSFLRDVQAGKLPEIFNPKATWSDGTPRAIWSRSSAFEEVKIVAAGLMAVLMTRGMSKADAAQKVARAAVAWHPLASGEIKASTVTNWRDQFLQSLSDDPLRARFESFRDTLLEGPDVDALTESALSAGPSWMGHAGRPLKT